MTESSTPSAPHTPTTPGTSAAPRTEATPGTPATPGSARGRRPLTAVALVASGLLAGGVLAGTLSASAATDSTTDPTSQSTTHAAPPAGAAGAVDQSQPLRSDETLLTGDALAKVTAAALATYPDATILRVETDATGVYEAHLTKADGTSVTVLVGADFAVTGEEAYGPGAGGRGPNDRGAGDQGPGARDGKAPADDETTGSGSSTTPSTDATASVANA